MGRVALVLLPMAGVLLIPQSIHLHDVMHEGSVVKVVAVKPELHLAGY